MAPTGGHSTAQQYELYQFSFVHVAMGFLFLLFGRSNKIDSVLLMFRLGF